MNFSTPFLVSGDVCDEVVFHSSMFKSPAFLSKLTSIKMHKSLRGVNASVFFLMCSLKAVFFSESSWSTRQLIQQSCARERPRTEMWI